MTPPRFNLSPNQALSRPPTGRNSSPQQNNQGQDRGILQGAKDYFGSIPGEPWKKMIVFVFILIALVSGFFYMGINFFLVIVIISIGIILALYITNKKKYRTSQQNNGNQINGQSQQQNNNSQGQATASSNNNNNNNGGNSSNSNQSNGSNSNNNGGGNNGPKIKFLQRHPGLKKFFIYLVIISILGLIAWFFAPPATRNFAIWRFVFGICSGILIVLITAWAINLGGEILKNKSKATPGQRTLLVILCIFFVLIIIGMVIMGLIGGGSVPIIATIILVILGIILIIALLNDLSRKKGTDLSALKLLIISITFWIIPRYIGEILRFFLSGWPLRVIYLITLFFVGFLYMAIAFKIITGKVINQLQGTDKFFLSFAVCVWLLQNTICNIDLSLTTFGASFDCRNFVDFPLFDLFFTGIHPLFSGLIFTTYILWFIKEVSNVGDKLAKSFANFVMVMFLLVCVISVFYVDSNVDSSVQPLGNLAEATQSAVINLRGVPAQIYGAFQDRAESASQDYYGARAIEGQNERLGVYLENVRTADDLFLKNEKTLVFAELDVQSLDDNIDIEVNCYAGDLTRHDSKTSDFAQGKITPQNSFNVNDAKQEDIDCEFPKNTFVRGGIKPISFTMDFNFETIGTAKRYFMQKDRLRNLQRENIDPFVEYDIADSNPRAVFTNGPVMIGIGPDNALVDIEEGDDFRFGVTLERNRGWEGKISRLNELIVQVPEGMKVNLDSCSHDFKEYEIEECVDGYLEYESNQFIDCLRRNDITIDNKDAAKANPVIIECLQNRCETENIGYNTYQLKNVDDESLENIDNFKTFTCRVEVEDINEVLKNSPIVTQSLRAKARYNYQSVTTTRVNVENDELDRLGSSGINSNLRQIRDEKELTDQVYQQWNNDIDTAVQESQIPQCLVSSIIARNVRIEPSPISLSGITTRVGLTKVRQADYAEILFIESFSNLNPIVDGDNIRIGTAQLRRITNDVGGNNQLNIRPIGSNGDNYIRNLIAAFRSGTSILEDSDVCQGSRIWECERTGTTTKRYVEEVMEYYTACTGGVSSSNNPSSSQTTSNSASNQQLAAVTNIVQPYRDAYLNLPSERNAERIQGIYNIYKDEIDQAISRNPDIELCTVLGVITKESNGNPTAVSRASAMGVMQMLIGTFISNADRAGIENANIFVPEHNILAGVTYLHRLKNDYNGNDNYPNEITQDDIIAGYNGGQGAMQLSEDCCMPDEEGCQFTEVMRKWNCPINPGGYARTQAYVADVNSYIQICKDNNIGVLATS